MSSGAVRRTGTRVAQKAATSRQLLRARQRVARSRDPPTHDKCCGGEQRQPGGAIEGALGRACRPASKPESGSLGTIFICGRLFGCRRPGCSPTPGPPPFLTGTKTHEVVAAVFAAPRVGSQGKQEPAQRGDGVLALGPRTQIHAPALGTPRPTQILQSPRAGNKAGPALAAAQGPCAQPAPEALAWPSQSCIPQIVAAALRAFQHAEPPDVV